jgi:hypothetical protein
MHHTVVPAAELSYSFHIRFDRPEQMFDRVPPSDWYLSLPSLQADLDSRTQRSSALYALDTHSKCNIYQRNTEASADVRMVSEKFC